MFWSKIDMRRQKRKKPWEQDRIEVTYIVKKICVRDKKNKDVTETLQSRKRKAEADASQLRRHEKNLNYDFIKKKAAIQLDFGGL